jgi:hypothetical protein
MTAFLRCPLSETGREMVKDLPVLDAGLNEDAKGIGRSESPPGVTIDRESQLDGY